MTWWELITYAFYLQHECAPPVPKLQLPFDSWQQQFLLGTYLLKGKVNRKKALL
jgi:hypothetical protein